MNHRLIVNGDDYGHTLSTSAGIRQAHLQGIVTSTTAMMNRPYAETALVRAMEECPNLGLGVHLVITSGKPLLPARQVSSLVDSDGNFLRPDALVANLDALDLTQVEAEWSVQISKFIAVTKRSPDHLDSHHHSSYFTPALFQLMTRLANQLGCAIRKPCNDPSEAALYLPEELQKNVTPGYFDLPYSDMPRTTDAFIGDFYDEGVSLNHLLEIISDISNDSTNQTFELMCHPALPDMELEQISSYNTMRGSELSVLTDRKVLKAIRENGIELISYGRL